jgi:hypothetical protein
MCRRHWPLPASRCRQTSGTGSSEVMLSSVRWRRCCAPREIPRWNRRPSSVSTAEPHEGTSLHQLTIAEAGRRLRNGDLTSEQLTEHFLSRIEALDHVTRSFVLVTVGEARRRAAVADRELLAGRDRGPLHGIPYALKDILDTAGIPTTNHSRLTADRVPERDSAAHERLVADGAVLLGKLATHEFALSGPSPELPSPPATRRIRRTYPGVRRPVPVPRWRPDSCPSLSDPTPRGRSGARRRPAARSGSNRPTGW